MSVDAARRLEIGRCVYREASDAFFIFDPRDGRVVDANPAAQRLSGFDRPELLALRFQDLFSAEDDGLVLLIEAIQRTQYFHSREGYTLRRRQGGPVPVNLSVSRIHTHPEPLGLVVVRDVSELRRARLALEQFFKHSPALFAMLGPEGRIRTTNPAWERSLGYAPGELLGRFPTELIHPDDRAMAVDAVSGRVPGAPAAFEARFRRKDGGDTWLSWCAGTIGGVTYAVALDVSTRREAEALRVARDAAEAASAAKNRLLANVSHELRTPLAAMLGLIDVMLEGASAGPGAPPASALRDDLAAVRRNGAHLSRLIDDLLDLSRAEAGRLEVRPAPCRPSEVLAEVIGSLAPSAREKGLELASDYAGSAPETIRTDALRLRQILLNLVGNAIKYTDRGRVFVRGVPDASASAPGPGPGLRFDIIDTGAGLSVEDLGGLFRPFHRGRADGSGSLGAGLGLAISRRIAELLGGTLDVESEPGRGTTFSLRLPAECPDPPAVPEGPSRGPDPPPAPAAVTAPTPVRPAAPAVMPRLPCRVLLAEDHADSRRAIALRLGMSGLDVTAVGDGQEAIDSAGAAFRAGRPFDVILMDMHMPVVDGYEATARLRDSGYPGPIIALTADAMSEDRNDCLRCGCDEHLAKPVDWGRLFALIASLVSRDRPTPRA